MWMKAVAYSIASSVKNTQRQRKVLFTVSYLGMKSVIDGVAKEGLLSEPACACACGFLCDAIFIGCINKYKHDAAMWGRCQRLHDRVTRHSCVTRNMRRILCSNCTIYTTV